MQCVKSVLLNKIISSEKDLVGVVLYGTVSHSLCSWNSYDGDGWNHLLCYWVVCSFTY